MLLFCCSCKSTAPTATGPTPFHRHLCLEALEHQSPLVLRLLTGFQVVPGNGRQPRLAFLRLGQVQGEYAVLWREQGNFGAWVGDVNAPMASDYLSDIPTSCNESATAMSTIIPSTDKRPQALRVTSLPTVHRESEEMMLPAKSFCKAGFE